MRPLPVTQPSRATISWVTISASRMGTKVQSRLSPYFDPVFVYVKRRRRRLPALATISPGPMIAR